MKERPILFSAPMVQGILEHRKTQTRRVVKPPAGVDQSHWTMDGARYADGTFGALHWPADEGVVTRFRSPYGQPGDQLWVRERHRFDVAYDHMKPAKLGTLAAVFYEAGGQFGDGVPGKSRVSIHMRRCFSRINLRITDVRVERLNEITEADALAEGVVWSDEWQGYVVPGVDHPNKDFPVLSRATAREMYAALWDTINGSGEWLGNPWVWVVTFERI